MIWSAPTRSCSRAAFLTASAPSQTTERMPAVGQKISGACVSVARRQSPCPPVCESGRSLTRRRGPSTYPCSTASLKPQSAPPASLTVVNPRARVSSRTLAIMMATRLDGCSLCWSRMFTSTAPMCTWASVSPGIRVIPAQSMVASYEPVGPESPTRTSRILSPSTTTEARSRGSAPVQSRRSAFARSKVSAMLYLPLCVVRRPQTNGTPSRDASQRPGPV